MSPHASPSLTPALLPGSGHQVLDLFAGTGVSVAVHNLGATDTGVEIMPEAILSRDAAGFVTAYTDVWDSYLAEAIKFDTLWASPPCQQYSYSNRSAGRRKLDGVQEIIDGRRYENIEDLQAAAEELGEAKAGLVLTPLHYVHKFRPTYVALEQVPAVLPVWESVAVVLQELGYSTWTGILNAEQYGVPQTRRRAILIARRDGGTAAKPVPTHSAYYAKEPARLDDGVLPYITIGDALSELGELRPEVQAWEWLDTPATTLCGDPRIGTRGHHYGSQMKDALRLTIQEAALVQSYPADFPFQGGSGKQFLQAGNAVPPKLAEAVLTAAWS